MEAYCVKCKTKREMKDAKQIEMKNGKPAQEGVCPVCGTRMFRIGAAKPAEAEKAPAKAAPDKVTGATKAKAPAKAGKK